MSDYYLIPKAWALPVAAETIGITTSEAQALVDAGELNPHSLASVIEQCAKADRRFADRVDWLLKAAE